MYNKISYYMTMTPFYQIRSREHEKSERDYTVKAVFALVYTGFSDEDEAKIRLFAVKMADAICLYQLDNYTEHNSEFLDSFYFDNLDDELSEALDFFTDPTNNNSTLNEQDVQQFVEQNRNKNTVNKTSSSLNVFCKWAKSINENKNIDEIPASDLDNILAALCN